jgi:hypothetical protein
LSDPLKPSPGYLALLALSLTPPGPGFNRLAHNNDANAPFEYQGIHHVFMQANFPGVSDWTAGAIGLAHLASHDLATYVAAPPAMVPGRWGGPIGGVGHPAGNATGGCELST